VEEGAVEEEEEEEGLLVDWFQTRLSASESSLVESFGFLRID
jgi:hypothetical protein